MVIATARKENGEICVAEGLATKTAHTLIQLVKSLTAATEPAISLILVIY